MERRTTDIYIYIIYIYENSTIQLASVGLAQARPNNMHYRYPSHALRFSKWPMAYLASFSCTVKYSLRYLDQERGERDITGHVRYWHGLLTHRRRNQFESGGPIS